MNIFDDRFRGFAAEHILHSGLASTSWVGEGLAIKMLNNANLSKKTLTIAKISLVNHGQEPEEKRKEKEYVPTEANKFKDISEDSVSLIACP